MLSYLTPQVAYRDRRGYTLLRSLRCLQSSVCTSSWASGLRLPLRQRTNIARRLVGVVLRGWMVGAQLVAVYWVSVIVKLILAAIGITILVKMVLQINSFSLQTEQPVNQEQRSLHGNEPLISTIHPERASGVFRPLRTAPALFRWRAPKSVDSCSNIHPAGERFTLGLTD